MKPNCFLGGIIQTRIVFLLITLGLFSHASWAFAKKHTPTIVAFSSGELTLQGELYLPKGEGSFPVVLYNHGSASGMKNSFASAAIAPEFVKNGWAFFMPYRRGQGLSENQGSYIMDEIKQAGFFSKKMAVKKLVALHQGEQLDDQLAALLWLKQQDFVQKKRIATVGNSFGGIQVVLGMEKGDYCAGVNASGAAQSWEDAPELQTLMKHAVANSKNPIFFYQAENDYDLAPSKVLSLHMEQAGKISQLKIYPPFGSNAKEGHRLPWAGVNMWFDDVLSFLHKYCP